MSSELQANQPSDRTVGNLLKNDAPTTKNYWPIAVAIGIILILAGVFLALAAHQILPQGVNAISDLGIWGKIIAGGIFILGNSTLAVSATAWYFTKINELQNCSVIQEPMNSEIQAPQNIHNVTSTSPVEQKKGVIHYVNPQYKEKVTPQFRQLLPEAHYYFAPSSSERYTPLSTNFALFYEKVQRSEKPNLPIVILKVRRADKLETIEDTVKKETYSLNDRDIPVVYMNIVDNSNLSDFSAEQLQNESRIKKLQSCLS